MLRAVKRQGIEVKRQFRDYEINAEFLLMDNQRDSH